METLEYIRLKSIVTIVRGLTRFSSSFTGHPDDVIQIPSRDPGRTIEAHVYRPNTPTKPSPVLINFHGSGFVLPMHGSDDEFCLYVASKAEYTVLDVSYRLAPENPFPAALNDAEDAIKWVLSQPLKFDLSHVAVSGFSAGANLGLAVTSSMFNKGTIRCICAFYPPTDLSKEPSTKIAPDTSGKPIPAFVARFFDQCYIPRSVDPKDPRVSPLHAQATKFPSKALIITCARDSLALEAEELAKKIEAVPGNHVVHRRMEECDHGWNLSTQEGTPQEKAKNDAYGLVVDILRL